MEQKERDLSKLPKWAAREIESLRGRIAARAEEDRKVAAGDTEVFLEALDQVSGKPTRIGLPPRSRLLFVVNGEGIEANVVEEGLRISGYNRSITVHPRASNTILIRLEK